MILITGASGFVGRHLIASIVNHSPTAGNSILPVFRRNAVPDGVALDLSDASAVSKLLKKYTVDIVVHLAAEARPHLCEADNEMAWRGNVLPTKNLLDACLSAHPYFLYISTDMVFGGTRDLYYEQDLPDPLNAYGRSKLEAESAVKAYPGDWCILRPALIYGAPIAGKSSFLSWMINAIKTGDGRFYEDEIRSPVWINDLVNLINALVSSRTTGVVHGGGLDCLSRVEFAEICADIWGAGSTAIATTTLSADSSNAWRPRNVCLHSPTAHNLVRFTDTRTALNQIHAAGQL